MRSVLKDKLVSHASWGCALFLAVLFSLGGSAHALDVTPPIISTIASVPTQDIATITWKTNEPSTSQVHYGLTEAYGSATRHYTTLPYAHSVVVSGLAPGTLYHYSVRSVDAAGNVSLSADQTFTTAPFTQTPLEVFVLAGQSNMIGATAYVSELPPDLLQPQNNVLVWQGGTWVPLVPGQAPLQANDHFGPEVTFAKAMSQYMGRPIGIIKLAVGGSSLASAWSPDVNLYYYKLLKSVQLAQKNRPIKIVGMVWVQGGRDAQDQTMANAYQANLRNFVNATRQDYGNPDMMFVVGGDAPPTRKFPYWSTVLNAQSSLVMPAYGFTVAQDLPRSDGMHFTSAGETELGYRLASTTISLITLAPVSYTAQGLFASFWEMVQQLIALI